MSSLVGLDGIEVRVRVSYEQDSVHLHKSTKPIHPMWFNFFRILISSGLIHNKCVVTFGCSGKKGKFRLFLIEHNSSWSCVWGTGGRTPLIRKLTARVFKFTTQSSPSMINATSYPMKRRLNGPQSESRHSEEKKSTFSPSRNRSAFPRYSISYLSNYTYRTAMRRQSFSF